jgi:oryzin
VRYLVQSGVFVTVAAGNEKENAYKLSPASESTACTVGAVDIDDNVASFSNWGPAVGKSSITYTNHVPYD